MKTSTIVCELQPSIPAPPLPMKQMYSAACSSDQETIAVWEETWLSNIRANKAKYGSFADHSIGQEFGKFAGKPCIIAGAGPSLKDNAHLLKHRPKEIGLVSCLHNFHFLIDHGADVDYWVTLDAGPITIEEVSEGGDSKKDYWAATEGQILIAYIGTHPDLLDKWRGKVLFFNAPVPSLAFRDKVFEIEQFMSWISNGGNVLGACMYFAKGYLGSQVTVFVGSDFCFSNKVSGKFHPWDSKYDGNMGQVLRATDIYGNSVSTWASYWNFKLWFDYVVYTLPGIYINASEGGCFGAYREGNIEKLLQMDLARVFETFTIHEKLRYQALNPGTYGPESDVILV